MAQLLTFVPRLLIIDMVCGCLFRVLVLATPARTTRLVKLFLPTKATAVCVLLVSRVRNVKTVRRTDDLMKTGCLSKTHCNGNENTN